MQCIRLCIQAPAPPKNQLRVAASKRFRRFVLWSFGAGVPAVVKILPMLGVNTLLYIPNNTMQKFQKINESVTNTHGL
jgi:hypothetical protein